MAEPAHAAHTLVREVRVEPDGPMCDVRLSGGRVASIRPAGEPADGARVVDGRGGTLLPGLVDAHAHMAQWAAARRRVSLAAAGSAAEAAGLVAAAVGTAAGDGRGPVVFGAHFSDGLWPDRPHKDLLERAVPGHPVALFSNDLHACWLSPAALALVGRGDHPTGVFVDTECMEITAALPQASTETQDRWVLDATHEAAARGVTGVIDFEYTDTVVDWTRRLAAGTPSVRVACTVARPVLDAAIERGHRTGDPVAGSAGLLEVGPFKLFVDGSLNTRTAYCHDPYPGEDGTGQLVTAPEELVALMRRAAGHGVLPAVHAIGDLAAAIALDAFAEVGCRGRIEHAQLLSPGDVRRFAELGVTAGVQPAHAPDDRDVADRYWAGRTGRAFAYAALLAAGARLEIGSDAPVSPLDPWRGIAAAVTRTADERPPWHAEQAIPVEAALAAASAGRDRVRAGDRADLVVTGADPRRVPPAELPHLPIVATLLAGRPTYVADGWS
ncbi:amidohydrolase family protein [Sphaerisporangium sp. TRM90804]|uniref:amidohydrolase n=1 Tax=Sphaerisporangium sp. TRM90804 TaxID=3031113 RepID=UPI002446A732|nr:amidohydrolase family protein [Sphaerisporangium sp. TRM90804]MDH2429475.1 amidohydrolase family protein [Sphaerisporangium sp. TRM90804]